MSIKTDLRLSLSRRIFSVGLFLVILLAGSLWVQATPLENVKPVKTKMLWIDAEQDVFLMSTKTAVQAILDKCTAAGINTIALDIKPFSGFVLYDSKIAPKMTSFKGKPYPEKFDLLKTVITEGHKRGLAIHAALNIFSEGLKAEKEGPVFAHPDWETVAYTISYLLKAPSGDEQTIAEVNQRTSDNTLVMYTPEYGDKVYPRNMPGNTIDGNTLSPSSKWVSDSTPGPHWLALEWPTPNKIDTVKLSFVKGYIIPKYRIQSNANGTWIDLVKVENNREANPIHSFLPLSSKQIRFFVDDAGVDSTARLMEIGVYSVQGGTSMINLTSDAQATADSVFGRGTPSTFYVISKNTVTNIVAENHIGPEGLEIPKDGYLISADGKSRTWAEAELQEDSMIIRGTRSRLTPETQMQEGTLVYVNPANPDVQERELSILEEVVKNYNVDGIVLDRVRYDNFSVDFSNLSRRQFEQFIGETVARWPEDIYQMTQGHKGIETVPGKYYPEWIYWRASVIKDFIDQVKENVKDIKPKLQFGDYVGAWYPSYYEVGVNWASSKYDPSREYEWATPGYRGTGYAESLDFLCPGLYYPELTVADALATGKKEYESLEGGIQLIDKVVGNSTKVFASLYYPNITPPETFKKAVKMALEGTDGVMIFSMINFESENKWDLLKEALSVNNVTEMKTHLRKPDKKTAYRIKY